MYSFRMKEHVYLVRGDVNLPFYIQNCTIMKNKTLQLIASYVIVFLGITLIVIALVLPPIGEIHPSVIAAFGEILTFAGANIGMDYHYRKKFEDSSSKPSS